VRTNGRFTLLSQVRRGGIGLLLKRPKTKKVASEILRRGGEKGKNCAGRGQTASESRVHRCFWETKMNREGWSLGHVYKGVTSEREKSRTSKKRPVHTLAKIH